MACFSASRVTLRALLLEYNDQEEREMTDYAVRVKRLRSHYTLQVARTVTAELFASGRREALDILHDEFDEGGHGYAGPPYILFPKGRSGEYPITVCLPVAAEGPRLRPREGIELRVIPGCTVASTIHLGPEDGLATVHAALRDWVMENGHIIAGQPLREIYLNDPDDTIPERRRTEVVLPITPPLEGDWPKAARIPSTE